MTKTEACKLLDNAPQGESPSRINPQMTQAQAVEIIRGAVDAGADELRPQIAFRVLQVHKNQKRPGGQRMSR